MHPENRSGSRSPFQHKAFAQGRAFSSKTFATGTFATGYPLKDRTFLAGAFNGVKGMLLGKKTFPGTTLPEQFLRKDPISGKSFATGAFTTRSFDQAGKSFPDAGIFGTREMTPKGKTQGAIDNNPKLEEAIRKGLSYDDVRNLLNKGP
jgi:hypothetical protein